VTQQLALSFRPVPTNANELLSVLREFGLKRFQRCLLTRNRTVMVSYATDELRIHTGYLAAPDDVLGAIVRFVEGRTRCERNAARKHLLSFPIAMEPRARRREESHPDDRAAEERLTRSHAELNARHFGGSLRPVRVRISRRMRSRLGHYVRATTAGDTAEIAIGLRHLRRHGWAEALDTLLHEMVHQWQDETGLPLDHGRAFRAKARSLGLSPTATRRAHSPSRCQFPPS